LLRSREHLALPTLHPLEDLGRQLEELIRLVTVPRGLLVAASGDMG
jgi:hypothetical protein